ncbi:MAG: carbon-nitrogen hydrolase family protein [Marinosulfonomonas sp.]
MRAALLQLNVSSDPQANLAATLGYLEQAAKSGATFILTPEVTNCIAQNRAQLQGILRHEADDQTLAALREAAKKYGIWLLLGSIAVKTDDPDGRFANRSFLISPKGDVMARYDKIHMFDASISATESYRESMSYRPGNRAVLADIGAAKVGMSICYDVRFPELYQRLAQAGAQILTVPSAFSPVTGAAHWETLLRARAIETGCFVLAPAQTGAHSDAEKPRKSWGHSLAICPWGEVLADAGTEPGITMVEINVAEVDAARGRVASLSHKVEFSGP